MWDTFNGTGIDKSGKTRLREFIEWKMAARIWGVVWSAIWGDDLAKLLLDPTFNKDTMGSHIPLVGSLSDELMRTARNSMAEAINAEFLVGDDQSWKKPALITFANKTGVLVDEDTLFQGRELSLWALQYVAPHLGLPGSAVAQNMVKMASATNEDGSLYNAKGTRITAEIPWLSDDNPLTSAAAFVAGSVFGTKAVDERTTISESVGLE